MYVFVIGLFACEGGPGVEGELKLLESGTDGWANDEDMFRSRSVGGKAVVVRGSSELHRDFQYRAN